MILKGWRWAAWGEDGHSAIRPALGLEVYWGSLLALHPRRHEERYQGRSLKLLTLLRFGGEEGGERDLGTAEPLAPK